MKSFLGIAALLSGLVSALPALNASAERDSTTLESRAVSWTATPFNAQSYPLAVRSPYLSTWLAGGSNGGNLNGAWPAFWQGQPTGWAGYVRVDGTVYNFLGAPGTAGATKATQTSSKFTATRSIFVLTAGPVSITATFLSPVEPTDFLRQSYPFSYLTVAVTSNDGNAHSIQVYTDISAEWVSGDRGLTATWSTTATDSMIAHKVGLQTQSQYSENRDQIQYGEAYYGITYHDGVTYATGQDESVRGKFISNGVLDNSQDTNYRAINNDWPVFALAKDYGSVTDTATNPAVFVVGHARDPMIKYVIANAQFEDRRPYWAATYDTAMDVLAQMLTSAEYDHSTSAADALDSKIASDAGAISSDYANIVALSTRQAMGGMEITLGPGPDTSDVKVFLKEISSDGNVNTVDVIFPAWPILLYLNPEYGRHLLEPLFDYQQTGQYGHTFSCHDLGAAYPQAIAHLGADDENMPVEESGDMVIMALSYTQKSGDTSLISDNYNLLAQWAQYLIDDSLTPGDQISTDDFAGSLANQTNLAIKGTIAIQAMSEIATLLGKTSDASNYASIAASYAPQVINFATASTNDHLELSYGDSSSWGLAYNLYAQRLLGFSLFPDSVFEMQTSWYSSHVNTYGIPLDTRHTYTKSDWTIWTAAIASDTTTRDLLIGRLATWAADGIPNQPFSDFYETETGDAVRNNVGDESFRDRPVVGGHFALLAL
ncbi:DUF1793-domain-containing protein [Stereum hirsutum FP-91666 SS1]|uniref:DUF1793-domain-containing protein n=1 Tax=Stereum hirsutum (strain FP-91666) TaxID=721885 RepID=UPI000440DA09|nr:DUF1793-domain-containing protein [Stereum hirsutum FP-91666 SS1]EIM87836.1 DUF1793-domain-containing protein [Stereum hirsutum FP-91666 SS1]